MLIVGPPRGGTTLVYQVLARYLPFSYLDNLSSMFPHSPITVSRLMKRRGHGRKFDFSSYYGNTAGLRAPNDGFHIWNRWLGQDRYDVPRTLAPSSSASMRRFFSAWFEEFPHPFLNKNNRNTLCLDSLSSSLGNVIAIIVKRDPFYVAQSLLEARDQVQGTRAVAWGALADDHFSSHQASAQLEDVAEQTRRIYRRLEDGKGRLPSASYVEITYEDFCADPRKFVMRVGERVWGLGFVSPVSLGTLRPIATRNEVRLTANEARILAQLISVWAD